MARRSRNSRKKADRHNYSTLEPRQLLAGISLQSINGFQTILIDGTGANDVAEVNNVNSQIVEATLNGETQRFNRADVQRVRFLGRNGNDVFSNNTSLDSHAYGHNGNDVLRGGSGNNWMQGAGGNDTLHGNARNDLLNGNDGADKIYPNGSHDRVFGGNGADVIFASAGNDIIDGGAGNDSLKGGDGNDTIRGGDGNDLIDGGDGDDFLSGQNDQDTIYGRAGNDTIYGGANLDRLFGNAGLDSITGGAGNDVIQGHGGSDRIWAGEGNDIVTGGSGNDTIDMGTGNDTGVYTANFAAYTITESGNNLRVVNNAGSDGADTVSAAETFRFNDGDRDAEPSESTVNLNDAEQASLNLLNQLRRSNGLSNLTITADLSEFAESWSRNMAQNGLRHSNYSQNGYLRERGTRSNWGENIVFSGDTSLTAQQVAQLFHNTWRNSSTHYRNMTNSSFTEVGIGIVRTSTGWWGTHTFSNG